MKHRTLNLNSIAFALVLWTLPLIALAEISLPALISDNMVLQQKTQAHIWGWAEPGEQVSLNITGREFTTTADQGNHWEFYLPQLPPGQYNLTLQGKSVSGEISALTVTNVAVGEVWLASGQSNMAWPLSKSAQAKETIANAQHPEIRFFNVTRKTALTPLQDVSGYWSVLTPETAGKVSGVAYHFAKRLHQELKVPVGIIESDWNNTKIQAWTGLAAMEGEPALEPLLAELDSQLNQSPEDKQLVEAKVLAWEAKNYLPDPGISIDDEVFFKPDYDDSGWQSVNLPKTLGKMGFPGDGAVWFRREITLPESWQGQGAQLQLGVIDDFDVAYVNGVRVGATTREQAFHWLHERQYTIPQGVLQAGRNVIAIRVFDQFGDGGFTSRAQSIVLKKGGDKLALAGDWKYHFSYQAPAMKADFASIPQPLFGLKNRNTPGVLYNAMIAPLQPYTLQGVIWYQGESDVHNTEQYLSLFPLLIRQWREGWQQRLPFLFVQLANFEFEAGAKRQKWAKMREVQTDINERVPGTGMVTAIDIGEQDNVHPKDKKTVGERLADWSLARVYGLDQAYQGPDYKQHVLEKLNNTQYQVRLEFNDAEGLQAKGDIVAFELAGADGVYHVAEAVIDKQTIVVRSEAVPDPVWLRYAWRDNPVANVYNGDDLPLMPFMRRLVD